MCILCHIFVDYFKVFGEYVRLGKSSFTPLPSEANGFLDVCIMSMHKMLNRLASTVKEY